jgi:hypothetical protein
LRLYQSFHVSQYDKLKSFLPLLKNSHYALLCVRMTRLTQQVLTTEQMFSEVKLTSLLL